MARPPYRIARQEHLGDALDRLALAGRLTWRWDYAGSRAIFHVQMPGQEQQALDTRSAEQVVRAEMKAIREFWLPVPHPGGESQREIVIRQILAGQQA
jgi:hypothetical protein